MHVFVFINNLHTILYPWASNMANHNFQIGIIYRQIINMDRVGVFYFSIRGVSITGMKHYRNIKLDGHIVHDLKSDIIWVKRFITWVELQAFNETGVEKL